MFDVQLIFIPASTFERPSTGLMAASMGYVDKPPTAPPSLLPQDVTVERVVKEVKSFKQIMAILMVEDDHNAQEVFPERS